MIRYAVALPLVAAAVAGLLFVLRPACPPQAVTHEQIPQSPRKTDRVPLIEDRTTRRPAIARRNLFAFVEQPPAHARASSVPVVLSAVVSQPPALPQQEVAHEPEFPLRYIGRFGPDQNPIAVFTGGGEVVTARIGDVVGEYFRLTGVGIESVEIASRGGTVRRLSVQP